MTGGELKVLLPNQLAEDLDQQGALTEIAAKTKVRDSGSIQV